jgi:sarcosine oxidase
MKTDYDCVVLGIGGIGSAALYQAARRGWKVLGVEQFSAAHALGSSHGQSRIIRQAYFEHPSYVPLTQRAYQQWEQIERASNRQLKVETGLLQVGWPDRGVIQGVLKSATEHRLALEKLDYDECCQRFPMFEFREDQVGVFEKRAGYLLVDKCVATVIELAKQCGADTRFNGRVSNVDFGSDVIDVTVDGVKTRTARLIITAGAWTGQLIPQQNPSLSVVRKHQHWFDFDSAADFSDMPTYLFETEAGYFYGFPKIDDRGFKVAEHTGSEAVDDPTKIDRDVCQIDFDRVRDFVNTRIKTQTAEHMDHSVCMYTLSPDEHFVIDRLDAVPNVALACGLSGHGFKFAPVIGQYLVDLLEGQREDDFEFLRMNRLEEK